MNSCENPDDGVKEDKQSNQEVLNMILAWLDTIEEKHGKSIHEILTEQLGK